MSPATTRRPVNRATVLDAALTLFAERGYHGTALSQIAQVLSMSTPSLYNHVNSKHDLLQSIVEETVRGVLADFHEAVRDRSDPVDRLYRAVFVYARRHATRCREALVVNHDASSLDEPFRGEMQALRREHEHALRQVIADGVAAGVLAVESPALASFAIREMCVSIARWYRPDGPSTAAQVAREYTEFALNIAGAGPRA